MKPKKILLAEDDPDDSHLFFEFLKNRPDLACLPVVPDGASLLKQLESAEGMKQIPDLIILDQNMPKMNGLKTLMALKANPRFSPIPVAIYSTYTDQHLVTESLSAGACAVVSKPLDQTGYHEMIDRLLDFLCQRT